MAKNVRVTKREGESLEALMKRFKKEVMKSCVLEEVEKRKYFRTNKEKAKFKHDMLMRHLKNKKYKTSFKVDQNSSNN